MQQIVHFFHLLFQFNLFLKSFVIFGTPCTHPYPNTLSINSNSDLFFVVAEFNKIFDEKYKKKFIFHTPNVKE